MLDKVGYFVVTGDNLQNTKKGNKQPLSAPKVDHLIFMFLGKPLNQITYGYQTFKSEVPHIWNSIPNLNPTGTEYF